LPAAARKTLESVFLFGVVGAGAVLMQALIFFFLAQYAGLSGFAANTVGFAVSLVISYWGQSRLTFSDRKYRSVSRFLIIAVVSFVIGSGSGWLIVDVAHRSPLWVLPIILLAIPAASFFMMRGWAFRHAPLGTAGPKFAPQLPRVGSRISGSKRQ
jgi:putative flippase GtrA